MFCIHVKQSLSPGDNPIAVNKYYYYYYYYICVYVCVFVFVVPFSVYDGTRSTKERNTYIKSNILQRDI